ncbi:lipopolysaccharide biosynthesis protein [Solitalea lacus]|uniref:lipopolysaccharide biosynthesis protein n=1 Tax=Solitalea lacus TaxID=2911172 RepID=UPI001EDB4CC3|nr:oligosaccharide flippase family protein [Solitalea lacus]UKJ07232.1 oligosaccharide flippase family protein [Solitalea lacus]
MVNDFKSKSGFKKNFITVFTGTTISQVLPVLISPVLTRLYSPQEIGIFTLYNSIALILATLITGRYEYAILLPKEDVEAREVVMLSVINAIIGALFIFVLLLFFGDDLSRLFNIEVNHELIYSLPLLSLSLSCFQVFNLWLNRKGDYPSMSIGKVGQMAIMCLGQLLFSALGSIALIGSKILGQVLSAIFYIKKSITSNGFTYSKGVENKRRVKELLIKYKDWPLYSLPSALLNQFSGNLPVFLLGSYFNLHVLGLYSWSYRIVQTPMNLVTSSTQQVFLQEANRLKHENKSLLPLVLKIYKKLFVVGLPCFGILGIFAPSIFGIVFGAKWEDAGVYTQLLIPGLFLGFMNAPIIPITGVLNKQKERLRYESVLIGFRFLALFLGYYIWKSPIISVALFGLVSFIYHIFFSIFLYKIAKEDSKVVETSIKRNLTLAKEGY